MRTIERTSAFKKDYKRVKATPRHRNIEMLLEEIVRPLALDRSLVEKHSDHALAGEWKDHRECHLKPDLLLIYTKPDAETLRLVRLGSHSDLF
ncbi:MAG TPA: type II toxin-antitoxin system YafQ family toxin [Acidobacteriaceae bacterium]|nr:type II toxin-antitoxin system YafQ family toxin [Acidobacteriaceae bacterium]